MFLGWLICHSFVWGDEYNFELFTQLDSKFLTSDTRSGACIANKIGDMADSKMGTEQIGNITQEIFHGFLGAGIGAGTAYTKLREKINAVYAHKDDYYLMVSETLSEPGFKEKISSFIGVYAREIK